MTVNTTDITSGPYTGNGVTTQFAYTFRIETKTQIRVFETTDLGVETELTVDTDYTIAGIGVDAGGTITRVAGALPLNYIWFIRSDYEETQDTAFASQGGFFPDVHEAAMDKMTFLIQQLRETSNRSASLSESYTGAGTAALPDPVSGLYLRWRSDLLGFENAAVPGIVIPSEAIGIVSDMEADVTLNIGDIVYTIGRVSKGDGGDNWYEIVAAATGTDDTGSFIDLSGSGHQAAGLFPGGIISRNQFTDDTKFDTYAAAAASFSEIDTLGFFSKGNASTGIHTSARGLLVRQLVSNLSGAVNVCPNGTVAALNAALSNVRVWDKDIRDDPTGQRRAWAIEMHQDGDGTIRSRLSTRSEGTSALKHTDVYHQFNGNNCFYAFAARGGIGLSALSMAWFPQPTSVKIDFQTTEGGESSTGDTNFWIANTTVTAGDEKAVLANDYQYLLCTTPGLTGGTEPVMPVTGTTALVDNVARWTVRSRIQKVGNLDAVPTILMDEDGNTVFGSMSPSASPVPFDFALDTNFRKLVSFDDTVTFDVLPRYPTEAGITAAGVSSLDNATQLTAEHNQVTTVAVDSGVKLVTAAEGQKQVIKNDSGTLLKIWPFNGDDLGAGTNTNVTLAAGDSTTFYCFDANTWFES